MYDVDRFLRAQNKVYENVIRELKKGKKETHWMWFIFPQYKNLGTSIYSDFYGISCLEEASEYIANETLHNRYVECCEILLLLKTNDIKSVIGDDFKKLKSSLTLFLLVDDDNKSLYLKIIDKYFDGQQCEKTIKMALYNK